MFAVLIPTALAALAAVSLAVAPARAQQAGCLTSEELREAVRAGHAVPAVDATRIARSAAVGEVLRVRLCREHDRLMYHVTTLARDGRVARVTIDGHSGKVAEVR